MHPFFLIAPLLLGISGGLRALTPVAVLFIAVWYGALSIAGTSFAFLDSKIVYVAAIVLALGELVGDKLPFAPDRTAWLGLVGRITSGMACGAILIAALSGNSTLGIAAGASLGVVGAMIGTFGGFALRTRLSKRIGTRDLYVAVAEDLTAIGLAVVGVYLTQ